MRQSIVIIKQCLKKLPVGPSISDDPRIVPPKEKPNEIFNGIFD